MHECHVTLSVKDAAIAEEVARRHGFKTSQIARDEVMGDETWFYCTKSLKEFGPLRDAMYALCAELNTHGIFIHRTKIEHIVWDWRPGRTPIDKTAGV